MAGLALVTGCGTGAPAGQATCPDQQVPSLRVTTGAVDTAVSPLSSTNLLDGTTAPAVGEHAVDQVARLARVPRQGPWVELTVGPASALQAVELDLHAAVSSLPTRPPIVSTRCQPRCERWPSTTDNGRLRVRLPSGDLRDGNVLVVSAFVQSCQVVGAVSWGLEFVPGHR